MKKILLILFCFCTFYLFAQNRHVLYDFDEVPQTLLLNPGAETNYKYHFGVPFISGISASYGITGFTVADLLRKDNKNFGLKAKRVFDKVTSDDYGFLNSQVNIIDAGMRLNKRDYVSFGWYSEVDAFGNVPKDLLVLIAKGNSEYINKVFKIGEEMNVKAEVFTALHFGYNRKINEEITVGARLKVYSGVLNAMSVYNGGTFTTRLDKNGTYTHTIDKLNGAINTSGVLNEEKNIEINRKDVTNNLIFGRNLGLGFDIGLTYNFEEAYKLTASITDLGFITYSKNNRSASAYGRYSFSGINPLNVKSSNLLSDLANDFKSKIETQEKGDAYTSARPVKFNSSIKHSWGKYRSEQNCYDISYKNYYNNSAGFQIHSVWYPMGIKAGITGFYEYKFNEIVYSKITYTVDNYSFTNIGIGVSAKIGAVSIYGVVDNVTGVFDIADSYTGAVLMGVSLAFKER